MGASSSHNILASKEAGFVQEKVKQNCVVIFSKTTCPYCHMAKKVFDDIGTPYEAVEINTMPEGYKIQEVLEKLTGGTTVPRVFVNGQCIGGGTETVKMQEQGKLIPLLQQCNSAS